MGFVNLYFKSAYSMLQSSCNLDKTLKLVKEYGYSSLAITDSGNMYATIKFYQKALKTGIKPILGLQLDYIDNNFKSSILLYAINNFGYRNLMKLSSKYMINNHQINIQDILNNSIGLLAVVPFYESNFLEDYLNHNNKKIIDYLNILHSSFDQLYIGLSRQNSQERTTMDEIYQFFKANKFSMVALSKISFLEENDLDVFQTLKAIDNGGILKELMDGEQNQYLYKPEEIEIIFDGYPELIENSYEIAKKCNVEIQFDQYHLPKYQDDLDANNYLQELCLKGLNKRLIQNQINDNRLYKERLKYELDTIKQMGFSDYFLIVWDFIKYAKNNNIFVGPGRGSAAASLVGYCLGITDIDPIYYNLLFERFLNKERITMPDIDTDFPDDTRDLVIKYVGQKYGINKVAHIITFGTFKAKLAIRDAARVYKLSEVRLKEITNQLDQMATKDYYNSSLEDIINNNHVIKQLMEDYEDINKVLCVASKLEGLPRNSSTHPAGIIITNHDLVNYTPLLNGLDDIYQTQYEASDLENLGLLKMDFLGLRNLTNIEKCLQLIQKDYPDFIIPKNNDDVDTLKMIAKGDVSGIFQLESAGMRKLLIDLKVSSFDDITHALALYRPGPMDIIPHFIARKFKEEKVEYPHPDLESILKETYGTIVYQDQIMLIARKFAGYSLGKADVLRRAVSKKKKEVLEQERVNFVNSSINQGYTKQTAEDIYDYIVKFANYGFNKAHSVAYARVAYLTAYLKCHYSDYYLATLMTSVIGSDTDIKNYYLEALKNNLKVIGPHINLSSDEFITKNQTIIFPLSMIRGLGTVKVKELLAERKKGLFNSFEDFIKRTSTILSGNLIENIIYSGALDSFSITKKAMIDNYQIIIDRMSYDFVENIVSYTYDNDEFTYGELLEKEKLVLGLNLKYNFIFQYQSLYKERNLWHLKDLQENTRIQTLGMIQNIKIIKTKNNENMAFIKISDEITSIELTLFPKTLAKFNNLNNGQLIIVKGTVNRRKDLQIIVDEIEII